MNITDAMDQVATQLGTISGLRVWAYPPDNVQVPAAIVSWPDSYTYDDTFGRGKDSMTLPVVVLVQRTPDRVARTALAAYCHGSGSSSIKAVLEAGTYTAFDVLRVESVDFDVVTVAGTDYWAANFSVGIAGRGGA